MDIKWPLFFHSVAAVLALCGIGIAVGMGSFLVAIISIVALFFFMGSGFKTKKRLREQGLLE